MPSRSRAVASTPGLPQYPISPAPTSTPLGADPDGLDEYSPVGPTGGEQLISSNTLRARTIRQIRLKECSSVRTRHTCIESMAQGNRLVRRSQKVRKMRTNGRWPERAG